MKTNHQPHDNQNEISRKTTNEKKVWRRPTVKHMDLKTNTHHNPISGSDGGTFSNRS